MSTVGVELGERSYRIFIEAGALREIGSRVSAAIENRSRQVIVVTDENVAEHYLSGVQASLSGSGFQVVSVVVPAGETSKSTAELDRLWQKMIQSGANRDSLIVALGGGVVGDLAGFAAATLFRGVDLVQVPTTLLSQVDSSVGGKTGINLPQGKNLVGAFYQPQLVLIDPRVLGTLDPREYRSGMAEVVKYGVIMDAEFFAFLENAEGQLNSLDRNALTSIIDRCCTLKARVVVEDEKETSGRRAILNYGHTFGHAIENVFGYGEYTHGEAISIGMTCAARLAQRMGMLGDDLLARQTLLLQRFGLPVECPQEKRGEILTAMKADKKSTDSGLKLVLPVRLGEVKVVDAPTDELILDCMHSDWNRDK